MARCTDPLTLFSDGVFTDVQVRSYRALRAVCLKRVDQALREMVESLIGRLLTDSMDHQDCDLFWHGRGLVMRKNIKCISYGDPGSRAAASLLRNILTSS